jgi:hypothetical protein
MSRSFRIAAIICVLVVLLPPCWCCSWSLATTNGSSLCCRVGGERLKLKRTCCDRSSNSKQNSERTSHPKTESNCCGIATKQIVRSEIELPDPLAVVVDWSVSNGVNRNGTESHIAPDFAANLRTSSLQIWHCCWQC